MVRAFLGLLLAFTLSLSAHAWPRHGSGAPPPPAACPKGTAFADGCAGLAALGHIGATADYANYAAYVASVQLSSQAWGGGAQTAQIEAWNMPGIAPFAIGPWTPRAAMLNAWDEVTAGHVPGCSTSHQADTTSPEIRCFTVGSTVDIEGLDFHPTSGTFANTCIYLLIQNNLTSLTLKNNHFQGDTTTANCEKTGNGGDLVRFASGLEAADVESNEFDGACATASAISNPTQTDFNDFRKTSGATNPGPGTYKFNRFHDSCFRPFNGLDGSADWETDNFLRYCLLCTVAGTHGEAFEYGPSGATCTGTAPVICVNEIIPSLVARFNLNVPAQLASAGMTTPFYMGDGGRKGTEYQSVVLDYNTSITNQFTVASTAQNYSGGTVTLTTANALSLFIGANVTISGVAGTGAFAQANGTFALSASSGTTISYVVPGAPAMTLTAATINGNETGATLLQTTGTLFDAFEVKGNIVDPSGGLNFNLAGTYSCIIQSVGNQGITGSTDGATAQFAATARGIGTLVPGAYLYGGPLGSIVTPGNNVIQPYGLLSTDGNGGSGTYYLSTTPSAGSSSAYLTSGVFGTFVVPASGGGPQTGGSQNWSLLSNTAITGFQTIDNSGSPVCH